MPIRGTRKWGTMVVAALVIIGVVVLMLFVREQRPALTQTYQGRNAGEWLYDFYRSNSMAELESNYLALVELRLDAVPLLAEAAVESYRESFLDRLKDLVREKTDLLDDTLDSELIRSSSVFALRCLQPTGPELAPLATRNYETSLLPSGKISALALLQFVDKDYGACVPLLRKAYASHNPDIGLAASSVISNWDPVAQPMDVLPALIDYVENTTIPTASSDYEVLGRYGFAASNAVPVIKKRFTNAHANDKVTMAAVLVQIDPNDEEASAFLFNIIKDTHHEHYTYARILLMSCGPEQQRLAEPLWALHQSLPEDDFNRRHVVEILVNLEEPREQLLALLRGKLAETERSLEQLNLAWFVLRLAPADAEAWKVFRSHLLVEFTDDNWTRIMSPLTAALGYIRQIPIPDDQKAALLREVFTHHSGTSGHEDFVRREAMKQLIRIQPDAQPTEFAQLWKLHGD